MMMIAAEQTSAVRPRSKVIQPSAYNSLGIYRATALFQRLSAEGLNVHGAPRSRRRM